MKAKVALADYDRTAALADGRVSPSSVDLDVEHLAPSEIFFRMLKEEAFDISEMSLSSYLIARSQGRDFTAIPVFPYRHCFHTSIFVRNEIEHPSQLKGKRFGLTEYQVTAALWARGVLEQDFGLDLRDVTWFVERSPNLSHGGETGFQAPEGITVEQVPEGQTLGSMLAAGTLDAALPSPYPGMASRLNRTEEGELVRMDGVSRLFRDPIAEARRYYEQHGFLHFNHVVILRNELVEQIPGVARDVFDAFVESKELAYQDRERLRRSILLFAHLHLEAQERVYGPDPFPYGFAVNERALERLIDFSHGQGLIEQRPDPRSLFASELLDS
jgi:4,5-dihydroxyphthalate decarboxylase